MNSKILLALCSCIAFSAGSAVSQRLPDQNIVLSDLEKARTFFSQNQYDSAAELSLKLSRYAHEQKLWPEFMEGSALAIRSLTRLRLYDSALHVAQYAYDAAKPEGRIHYREFAELARQYFNAIHFAGDSGFILLLIRKMKEHVAFIKSIPMKERFVDSLKYKAFEQLGGTYYQIDIFDQSLLYYDSALQIGPSLFGERSLPIAELYSRFNILNINIGDHASAYDFAMQSYSIIREKVSGTDMMLAVATGRIGEFWIESGTNAADFRKGLSYLEEAVKILKLPQNKASYFRQVQFQFLYSKAYLKLADYNAANRHVDQAIQIWTTQQSAHLGTPAELLTHKAKILLGLRRHEEAINLIDESSAVYRRGAFNELARNYALKGDVFLDEKNADSALYYYHQAFHVLVPQGKDSLNLLQPINISNESPNEILLTALIKRTRTKKEIFETQGKEEYLRSALQDYLALSRYLKQSRRRIVNNFSRIRFKERTSFIYEEGIECATKLFDLRNEQRYIQEAFNLADFRKYSLILDQLEDFQLKDHLGVNPDLLMQEKQLTDELNIQIQQHHNLILSRTTDSEAIKGSEKKVFDLKMKLRDFSMKLEEKYPGYYHLKYDAEEMLSPPDIEKIAGRDRLILQYFTGEKNMYVFSASADRWDYFKIENPVATDSLIEDCIQGLKNRSEEQFGRSSHKLYQQLLAGTLEKFPSRKHLIIIPDGKLGYLPFETLLVSQGQNYGSYKTNDFLIKHFQVSYHYSASLLVFNFYSGRYGRGGFIGYAPNALASVSPLPGSLMEVKTIAALMNGELKEGTQASESSFKREAPAFNILHLASHNIINDRDPLYSQLFFTKVNDQAEDDILHTYELFTTNLNADLVSLSACSTGAGKLYQGEGIMSLGMGFFYAGVPNVLTSLWDISDQSASDIMTYFYEEIKNDTDYATALHRAKLRYLNESDNITADPHYWSGFIFIGQPYQGSLWKRSAWIAIPAIVLLGITALTIAFIRKRRIRTVTA